VASHASVSRDVNRYIRETAEYLARTADRGVFEFLCACGCSERVRMTLEEFDACDGEPLAAGHVAIVSERERQPPLPLA
jgi:hypothetical protein